MKDKYQYKSVMVIDDSSVDLYVAQQTLKLYKKAQEVILKQSASEALEYLLSHKDEPSKLPEIILLDLLMPGMDGFAFLNEYKKFPDSLQKQCRIIMLSSTVNLYDYKRININPLIEAFISKPLVKDSFQYL